jgi:hypothetical protein
MRVQPQSEEEINESGLYPAGTYDFEVLEAQDQTSKSGNEMIMLKIAIFNSDGASRHCFDYLVSTPGASFKVRHFCESVGILSQYESGEIDTDTLVGRSGRAKIKIDKGNGDFPAKNAVVDYVKAESTMHDAAGERVVQRQTVSEELDDSIPFN